MLNCEALGSQLALYIYCSTPRQDISMYIYLFTYVLYILCMYVNTYVCLYLMFLQITYAALQFSEEAGGNGKNDIHCKEELVNVQYSEVERLQV